MSKCSKLCNELKNKIDSISGLDDNYTYEWLLGLEKATDYAVDNIMKYADKDKFNGTCFKGDENNMNKADKLLIKHNMYPGFKGYTYIKTILESNILNSDINITDIYSEVAKRYNTTGSRVERAIRHLLSKSDINKSNKIGLSLLQLEFEGEN